MIMSLLHPNTGDEVAICVVDTATMRITSFHGKGTHYCSSYDDLNSHKWVKCQIEAAWKLHLIQKQAKEPR